MDAFQIARIGATMPKTNGNGFHHKNISVDESINAAKLKVLSDKVERLEFRINELVHKLSTSDEQQKPSNRTPEPTTYRNPTVSEILRLVCQFYKITKNDILSACRRNDIVYVRHVAMYLARNNTLLSLPRIGEMIGRRDHTTIMHGINKITDQRILDQRLNSELIHLESQLKELSGNAS